ncbi:hypothetical protein [Formosa sp. PL04]|uniref:hypothetical protein n=1 Tax=Formosa sp. PL04 TaxID=3081755 RepID=UPI00298100E4|nr:hypothetical protein [Formosa sp. PL04]MDW5290586.1 hypothetical protein [Formosa sp. PL04]
MKNKITLLCLLLFVTAMKAQESTEELAKAAQNPLANIMSFPFQNNTNFGYGPNNDRTQDVLNIQPVLPFFDGKLITRTIIPILWQPDFTETSGTVSGVSNINFTAFYVPKSKGIVWGFGPIIAFPAGNADFGSKKLSVGPSIVVLKMGKKWVYGGVINNTFSVAGPSDVQDVNNFYAQVFANYNLPKGLYLNTSPIITANWEAESGQQWTVPIGAGIGKIVKLGGKLPVNFQAGYYYNIVSPDFGPTSQLRLQATVMLPTSLLHKSEATK